MYSSLRKLGLGLIAVSLPVCGPADLERETRTATMDSVNGTVIVRNGTIGLWQEREVWVVSESFRIGSREGEDWELFEAITVVNVGPGGEIAAVDFRAQRILLYSPEGKFLRQLGGPGRGPGEFDGPLAVGWDNRGNLWAVDGWNRRYTVFDPSGAVLRTVERRIMPGAFRQRILFVNDSCFFDETSATMSDGRQGTTIVRVDTSGSTLEAFPPLARPHLGDPPVRPFPAELVPYTPRLVFSVMDDKHILIASSDDYRILKRTLEGDTVQVIETEHRRPALTPSDVEIIRSVTQRRGIALERYRFGRQVIQSIHTLDDGHIVVMIEREPGEYSQDMDVFDQEGRFLGSVAIPFAVDPGVSPVFQGDTMIAVTRDEWDVQYIVSAVIHRDEPQEN